MLTVPPTVRIFIAREPTHMNRSFDRLAAMVQDELFQDPLSGHLFVFKNRRGDKLKILLWDRTGYVLWYKRLERGVFHFPRGTDGVVEVEAAELSLLLEGIDLAGAKRQRRFRLSRSRVPR